MYNNKINILLNNPLIESHTEHLILNIDSSSK